MLIKDANFHLIIWDEILFEEQEILTLLFNNSKDEELLFCPVIINNIPGYVWHKSIYESAKQWIKRLDIINFELFTPNGELLASYYRT